MTVRSVLAAVLQQEDLNFLLTNRIPRRLATRFVGWFSQIEQPLVRDLSIALWRFFADVDLSDGSGRGSGACTTASPASSRMGLLVDPDPSVLVSPRDGIVGAHGRVEDGTVLQAKGFPTRSRTCWSIRRSRTAIARAATSPSVSPRACTTASTRRTTAGSSG
jgi:phosphatidylserine decarboxylase